MTRFNILVAASLALWGIWLISSIVGVGVAFDGLAFLFAAISSSQLILLATKNGPSDAFKTLLALQAIANAFSVGAIAWGADPKIVRIMLMYAAFSLLVAGYTIALRRRRIVR